MIYKKTKKKKVRKSFSWLITFVGAGFAVLTIYLTIQTVTSGAKLAHLEKQEQELTQENSQLNDELVKSSSLTAVSETAEELGFAKPEKIIYATQDDGVAAILP